MGPGLKTSHVLTLLAVVAGNTLPAQTPDPAWDITKPRGNPKEIDFTTSEGTWMSTDITPDGRWIVFNLLGHIYRMPATGGQAECLTQETGLAVNFHPRISPDGSTIAYSGGQIIAQTVTAAVQLGITYTLLIDIGHEKGTSQAGYAELWIGGINQSSSTLINATGGIAPEGRWTTVGATYTGSAADVGKSITIALRSTGIGGAFDNVRLSTGDVPTTAATPEPSSAWLIGGTLFVGMGRRFFRRRR